MNPEYAVITKITLNRVLEGVIEPLVNESSINQQQVMLIRGMLQGNENLLKIVLQEVGSKPGIVIPTIDTIAYCLWLIEGVLGGEEIGYRELVAANHLVNMTIGNLENSQKD